jgi:hypothetical protein
MTMGTDRNSKPVLSVLWLWAASLPFRRLPRGQGFSPGIRNVLRWEFGRLSHLLLDRDRLRWWRARLVHFLRRSAN